MTAGIARNTTLQLWPWSFARTIRAERPTGSRALYARPDRGEPAPGQCSQRRMQPATCEF